jgi:mannitol/fructose-specific phosphotransferase system IIA component (Ntr-type)
MKSILNALQEGRLIELPDNDKKSALEYLAALLEAVPDIGVEGGITETVLAREQAHNTGIGKGWACPHARSPRNGEVVCSVGWSPAGIDYGAPDNQPVHILVMYFIPESQKNTYLKEISLLAKAIQSRPDLQDLKSLEDLNEVRHRLLDAISEALEATAPDARARMIQLEVKHATAQESGLAVSPELAGMVIPVSILALPGSKPILLCQDRDLVTALEGNEQLSSQLVHHGRAEHNGIQVVLRASSHYQPDRWLHECLAFRATKPTTPA